MYAEEAELITNQNRIVFIGFLRTRKYDSLIVLLHHTIEFYLASKTI